MIGRRSFLSGLVGAGFLVPQLKIPIQQPPPSGVLWSGWREPVDHFFIFGFWFKEMSDNRILISTTLGEVGIYRELNTFPLTQHTGWPTIIRGISPEHRQDELKDRAYQGILSYLRAQ